MFLTGKTAYRVVTGVIAVVFVVCLSTTSVLADWEPTFNPILHTQKASGPIKVDGNLNDPGWRGVGHVTKFHEIYPGENTEPGVKTEAFITYDDDNLYVAFLCFDNPHDIRATMAQRDQFHGNDEVGINIDPYHEASWGYSLFVNAYGIQNDGMYTVTVGTDDGFDLIWESAGKITDSGYQVEMAIPFASMRFPITSEQNWGVQFVRNRPRDSYYQYTWGADDRNEQCFACKWGTVLGISDVHPGKGMEILPTVVADQAGSRDFSPNADFENESADAQLSLGGKYSISSAMTAEAYYNPDFSQVEADAAQIDVNTTIALLFPERRPFFQEGADLFSTIFNSFYTRTVYDPEWAAKFTGRTNQYSIAFMTAQDEKSPYTIPLEEYTSPMDLGRSWVNVLRGRRNFNNGTHVGFMLTDRRFEGGGSGTILSLDGIVRLSRSYGFVGQVVQSYTTEPDRFSGYVDSVVATVDDTLKEATRAMLWDNRERFDGGKYTVPLDGEKYNGLALITQFRRMGRSLSFTLDYDQVGPSYRTQTGYDPWNDQRNTFANVSYRFYPTQTVFERIFTSGNVDARWNFNGDRKWYHASGFVGANLRVAQAGANISYTAGEEVWSGNKYRNVWNVGINFNVRPSDAIGCGVDYSVGHGPALNVDRLGGETSFGLNSDIKPIDRLIIEPSINWLRSIDLDDHAELFRQFIARTRVRLQITKNLSLRLVLQYNDFKQRYRTRTTLDAPSVQLPVYGAKRWDVDPLITFRLSPFSLFYVGSTNDYYDLNSDPLGSSQWKLTSRRFFLKLQYLFQV